MVARDIRDTNDVSKRSRRRKKKRTTEVSDSSDSLELSSDEGPQFSEKDAVIEQSEPEYQQSENEDVKPAREILSEDTRKSLNQIPFTRMSLNGKSIGYNDEIAADLGRAGESSKEIRQNVRESNEDGSQSTAHLKNSYLELLFENYGDDINSLKNAPDFTKDSLAMIAQVLKDGSCMFDVDTLKAMLDSK